jgi:hypothetical protein
VWLTTADNATVKFNPGLGNPAPIGCIPMLSFSPLGDAQRGYNAGTVAWCVAGTPERGTAILRSSAPIVGGTALYGFHVVAQYQNRQHVPGTA